MAEESRRFEVCTFDASLVDVALLPKAIGGDASSIDEKGEEDERCVRGFKFPSVNDYVASLKC